MTSPDSTEILPRPPVPGVDVGALLGRGGFAAVYRGRHRTLDTDVAVKIVETPLDDASAVERVLREARLMARLDHPNLMTTDGKYQRVWVPQWAAPEAPRKDGQIVPSVDIYGLGEILYYCLAGMPAYAGDMGPGAIMLAKLDPPHDLRERRADVTGPTARLASELLSPDPARRPPSAAAVRDELASIARRLRGG